MCSHSPTFTLGLTNKNKGRAPWRCIGSAQGWQLQDVCRWPLALRPSFSSLQNSLEILHPEGFAIFLD